MMGANLSAIDCKQQGNEYFNNDMFDEALRCYTECILKDPTNPVYFCNRARAEIQLLQYEEAVRDYRKAIGIDPTNTKAYYGLGQTLCLTNQFNEGVDAFKEALATTKDNEIWKSEVIKALEACELKINSAQREKLVNFQIYLSKLIQDDEANKISKLTGGSGDGKSEGTNIKDEAQNKLEILQQIFLDEEEKLLNEIQREIPDYLCCKITLDIFRDPVITPNGVTYERKWLEQHFRTNGNFDPSTYSPLEPAQLIPNLSLKEAVNDYLAKNEWARRYL